MKYNKLDKDAIEIFQRKVAETDSKIEELSKMLTLLDQKEGNTDGVVTLISKQ